MNGLETERLRIREYGMEDTAALYELLSDPVTMSFWPSPFTYKQSEEWIVIRGLKNYHSGYGRFAVEWKETGKLIGDAGLLRLEIDGRLENDIGYIIQSEYWGLGLGCEAADAVMNYALEKIGLQRLCANMPDNHKASSRVAEKIGMSLEKKFWNINNRNILTRLYVKEQVHRKPIV